jgi:hypothetical protein
MCAPGPKNRGRPPGRANPGSPRCPTIPLRQLDTADVMGANARWRSVRAQRSTRAVLNCGFQGGRGRVTAQILDIRQYQRTSRTPDVQGERHILGERPIGPLGWSPGRLGLRPIHHFRSFHSHPDGWCWCDFLIVRRGRGAMARWNEPVAESGVLGPRSAIPRRRNSSVPRIFCGVPTLVDRSATTLTA